MSTNSLSILHLSDLHVCNTDADYLFSIHGIAGFLCGGPALQTDFSSLRRTVGARAKDADWILITGDITHTGRIGDLREARELIFGMEGDISNNRGDGCSLALIPGNHDRYENKGPDPGNVGPFEEKFKKFWSIGQGVQFRVLSEQLRVQAGFADFSLQKKDAVRLPAMEEWRRRPPTASELRAWLEMWGNGCVHDEVLNDLADSSAGRISDGWSIIWVIHFAPFHPGFGQDDWKLRLRNEEKLMSRARDLGVTHIFCGHTHQQDHYNYEGVEIFCAGQSLRDSRFSKARCFSVRLFLDGGRLTTQSWENIVRSVVPEGSLSRPR